MEIGRHIEEDDLDRFSMGTMSEEEAMPFEEHLLMCAECRQRVASSDEFVAAVRSAAARLHTPHAPKSAPDVAVMPAGRARGFRAFHPAWALAFASVAAAFVLARGADFLHASGSVPVSLTAMRGALPGAEANAGNRLALSPDITGLPVFASYRMEVVDTAGHPLVNAEWKHAAVTTPRLSAGTYFVRIYSPAGELLREYGLIVKKSS